MLTSMQPIANDIARRRTQQGFGHRGLRLQAAARGGRPA